MPITVNSLYYWAKTTANGQPGISVFAHNQNVGWCAELLAQAHPAILELFGLSAAGVATLAALHDIGKISEGFLSKCPAWVEEYDLVGKARKWRASSYVSDHALISQYTVANLLGSQNLSIWWALAVGAHHGRLKKMEELGLDSRLGMQDDDWEASRKACAAALIDTFGPLPQPMIDPSGAALWWVAGLITVADWIGSNELIFSSERDVPSDDARRKQAESAIKQLGLAPPDLRQGLMFSDLFEFEASKLAIPNALQLAAYDAITEPGIYVIEAPMGMGKTEAALWVTYRLMCEGKASGLYFALPTQVTSNRIHRRVGDFVRRIVGANENRVHLIHANSWLLDDLAQPTFRDTVGLNGAEEDWQGARDGRDWFASAKRAILAPFGVGTVDQALLGVVAAKHFFVRRAALAGKVVVIDEVHSYDLYTGTLIHALCETLRDLGCTVILLSATLTARRRDMLLGQRGATPSVPGEAYPLISGVPTIARRSSSCVVPAPKNHPVALRFINESDAFQEALAAARRGACVLWVCNTVGNAQAVYRYLRRQNAGHAVELGLLHSRFPFFQRRILEDYWMERLGKDPNPRNGCILVATQVVEQSVDLDADLLVTDIAPTDMLWQRIGRLWRHNRLDRPLARAEAWIINPKVQLSELRAMTASEITDALKPSSKVYNPYVLLRTMEEWQRYKSVTVPDQIRTLLENTYSERDDDPPAWQELDCRREGEAFTHKTFAETQANIWQAALTDVEGKCKTRLDDRGTISVILAQQWDGTTATLLMGDRVQATESKYQLATAKAVHQHLVKAPDWVLEHTDDPAGRYVYEPHCIAVVGADGLLQVSGVKQGYQLRYTPELGLAIESQSMEDTRDNDESCF